MPVVITSLQNPLIRNIQLLMAKPGARRDQNRVVIEGYRETNLAIAAGFQINDLILCRDLMSQNPEFKIPVGARVTEVSGRVFSRLAYREDSGGIIAISTPKRLTFNDLILNDNPLFLVLETVEKPGNLGAVLRTADAAGITGVIVCDPRTDIYNPNVIRSSVGCIFTVPVVTASTEETLRWTKASGIITYAAALTASEFYHETDYTGSCAIVMGSEADGLSAAWLEGADRQVKIPMRGLIDSMNVSVSAAVIVFEAMRQRGFGKGGL